MGRKGHEKISQREYARRLNISNEAVSKAVREGRIKEGWNAKEGKIIVEKADREFGLLHRSTNITELIKDNAPGQTESPIQTPGSLTLNGGSSYGEAKRVKEILQAQLVALDLKQRKDELVNKEEVYKQLYAFGQQMRVSIMTIPDRTIDNILAAKNRAEAHNYLTAAIHETLESLTNIKIDLSAR